MGASLEADDIRLVKIGELKRITGFSLGKLYQMAATGEIPSLRTGRSVRVPLAAFKRWLAHNTVDPVNPTPIIHKAKRRLKMNGKHTEREIAVIAAQERLAAAREKFQAAQAVLQSACDALIEAQREYEHSIQPPQ